MKCWDVGDLPFVFTMQSELGNGGFPEFLPFCLIWDEELGLLRQRYDEKTNGVLERAYGAGSELSGLMEDHGNGLCYAEDFHRFIEEQTDLQGKQVLEIGSGTGYFLSRLKRAGAEVLGLEPGPHGKEGMSKYGVPIVDDFFPSPKVSSRFDLIVSFCVLEHIAGLQHFLQEIRNHLVDRGRVVFAVPECGRYIEQGDVSFLFHEHWNYFTTSSLSALLRQEFGEEPVVVESGYGGCLYATVELGGSGGETSHSSICTEENEGGSFDQFKERALRSNEALWKVLEEAWANEEVVGVYVPWRAVNVLGMHHDRVQEGGLRFFDDNPCLKGTYYPGFSIGVEGREDLIDNPPDRILVMSYTFGEEIACKLKDEGLTIPIHTWTDLFIPSS